MAELPDTNLLWRGGEAGLRDVQAAATAFNRAGGVCRPGWRGHLLDIHAWMVARDLSPGGSADLVAATWLVHGLESVGTVGTVGCGDEGTASWGPPAMRFASLTASYGSAG
jgi:triphosphoribosyl-dephospho-CoA synthetase